MTADRPKFDSEIPVLIAGAGLSGLSAARELPPGSFIICESSRAIGGLCASFQHEGYTFDYTGHLLHLKGAVLEEVERLLGDNLSVIERRARVHTHGAEFDYPFQVHLAALPPDVRDECLRGFEAVADRPIERENFESWCRSALGEGIFRHFMRPYNEKLYRTPLAKMSADWVGWIPRPSLEEVRAGASGKTVTGIGYNAVFRYPKEGGIGVLPAALAKNIVVRTGTPLVALNGTDRIATLRRPDGSLERIRYGSLLSTVPLTALVEMTVGAPDHVRKALGLLDAVGVVCLNVGIDGPTKSSHWIYFPEEKYIFFRVGFYHNFAVRSAPPGKSALYVEISCRRIADLPANYREKAYSDLVAAGIVSDVSRIETCKETFLPAAYGIHNTARQSALKVIVPYLESVGVTPIGRYGRWAYTSMGEALSEGMAAGKRLRETLPKAG